MLSRRIFYIAQRTICENRRIFHSLGTLSRFDSKQCNLCVNSPYLHRNPNLMINKRFRRKKQTVEHDDDIDNEEDSLDVDDYLQTKSTKIINSNLPSLRLEVVAKAGFGLSRAKIEQAFYNSNIRVNGEKRLKKSRPIEVEDEIDLIIGRSPDNPNFLIVHRCILLSAKPKTDSIAVKLIRNKSLLIEDYKDPWNGVID